MKNKLAIGYIHEDRAVAYDAYGREAYRGSDRMLPPCQQIVRGEVARRRLKALDRKWIPTDGRQGELF